MVDKRFTTPSDTLEFPELNVFCVGSNHDANWLPKCKIVSKIQNADVVIFPGGSDWNPALYNESMNSTVGYHAKGDIDQIEQLIIAIRLNKFIIGICRGAQLLGITAGGSLFQNVTRHAGVNGHLVETIGKNQLYVNSYHHQMVHWDSIPNIETRGRLVMWADSISTKYENGFNREWLNADGEELIKSTYKEPEMFYFPTMNAVGIQGHPEFGMVPETMKAILKYIKIYYNFYKKKNISQFDIIVEDRLEHFGTVYGPVNQVLKATSVMKAKQISNSMNSQRVIIDKPIFEGTDTIIVKEKEETKNETKNEKNRIRSYQGSGKW